MTDEPGHTPQTPRGSRRRPGSVAFVALAVLCAAVAGVLLLQGGDDSTAVTGAARTSTPENEVDDLATSTTTTTTAPEVDDTTSTTTAPSYPTGVRPARLVIPSIGVDASSVDLDLSGAMPEVPQDFGQVGWYQQTRRPGEIGPAVMAGHIDSTSGPAVFFRLDELTEGDEVTVVDDAGEQRTFRVTGSGQYPKEDLPPEVFGFGDGVPELRLITCGGAFDRASGHYRDNLVVYATAV